MNENVHLEAVKKDGWNIRFISDQVENTCLTAVKQNGYIIQCIENQTESLCLLAAKKNGLAIRFIRDKELKEKIRGMLWMTLHIYRTCDAIWLSTNVYVCKKLL